MPSNFPIISFNGGLLTEQVDARSDVAKYASGCRILENFIPRIYGSAERRPGTHYKGVIKDTGKKCLVVDFIYSDTTAYIMEFGEKYIRFYLDGGRLELEGQPIEVVTPYLEADLYELQFNQSADVLWITHENYAPRKLTRTGVFVFSLAAITFTKGPFLERNDLKENDGKTLTSSVTAKGATGTLTASADTFETGHVGSIWKLRHKRADTEISISTTIAAISTALDIKGDFTFNTHKRWSGTVKMERKVVGETDWETFRTYISKNSRNIQYTGTEEDDNVQYRINVTAMTSGTIDADMTVNNSTQDGIVRVDSYTSATVVNITVLSEVGDSGTTIRWSEGAWSDVQGYPRAFAFFEERAVYAGTTGLRQTIWFSESDDFEDFEEGVNDSDSFSLTLPATNEIRWIASLEALVIGTAGDEWRIRATEFDAALTPTDFNIRQQTEYGSKNMQALKVNDAVLFVDYVGRKIREMSFSDEKAKYVSPDLTALNEEITKPEIVDYAHQREPDSILWCVLSDGQLISLTYERDQNVVAWAKHPLQDGVVVESVAVIPSTQEDEIWLTVKRVINGETVRYMERMYPRYFDDWVDSVYMDSSVTFKADGTGDSIVWIDEILSQRQYPTLQELQAKYIPAYPTEPTIREPINPTLIEDADGLQDIENDTDYILTADIDLDGVTWTPLVDFNGMLDGHGYTISNLTVGSASDDNQGLFATLDDDAIIQNLNLKDFTITADDSAGCLVGLVNQKKNIIIKNVNVDGATITLDGEGGGLIGFFYSIGNNNIFDCSVNDIIVTGPVWDTAHEYRASFIGRYLIANSSVIRDYVFNCSATATSKGSGYIHCGRNSGGFVGSAGVGSGEKVLFHTCTVDGNIEVKLDGADIIITGLGGFAGVFNYCDAVSCNTGAEIITDSEGKQSQIGGFAGFVAGETGSPVDITNCYSTGRLLLDQQSDGDTFDEIGGFVGKLDSPAVHILRCYSTGSMNLINGGTPTINSIGGFVGEILGGTGETDFGWIKRSFTHSNIFIENLNTGNPAAVTYGVGGFTGVASGEVPAIENCYTWSSILAAATQGTYAHVGGFIGHINDLDGSSDLVNHLTVLNAYAAQTYIATGSSLTNQLYDLGQGDTGGFLGADNESDRDVVCTACFWDEDTSGTTADASNGADGKDTQWLQVKSHFEDDNDWDFDEIWYMPIDDVYIGGLDHLEAEEVAILCDGSVFPAQVVLNGRVKICQNAQTTIIGLPFRYKLMPMKIAQMAQYGYVGGSIKRIAEIVVNFMNTLNAQYGKNMDNLYEIMWRTEEPYDSRPDLFTGEKTLAFDGGFSMTDDILITGDDPLPCTVRSIR
jgi:hypothetical protein